ncbi:hypothetical protein [Duganella levis]|uniref:Uncharacterized protein n=1 Tax=Duganella levis TaxID=2692169 RepID=A0ABW9W797_9BURK|nr:hypothetical protein [Duganella levis]MYN29962.1 hypothetical protein [Duganella levis]
MAISVKEAVKAAKDALLELYADDPPKDMALEEIERRQEEGKDLWLVTLGFYRRKAVVTQAANQIGSLFNPALAQIEHRVYKMLSIDAQTGTFVKMDIRQVQ